LREVTSSLAKTLPKWYCTVRGLTADRRARYFGATLDNRSLIPGDDASIAPTRFEDWFSQTMVKQTKPQEAGPEAGST
jgi:hypothetical protein